MKEENATKIAKGAGTAFVGIGIGMFLSYLGVLLIARYLGPEGFGLISLASTITIIVTTIVLVGLADGVVRFVSYYNGDKARRKGTVLFALKAVLALGLLASFIVFLFAEWVSVKVFHDESLIPVLRIFSIGIPFYTLLYIGKGALQGLQEIRLLVSVRDIIWNCTRLALLVGVFLIGFGVVGVAFAYVFAIAIASLIGFYYTNKKFQLFSNTNSVSVRKELLSFSLPLMFVGMVGLVTGWTDTIMLGYFLTTTDIGIYRIALSTASIVMMAPSAFGTIFYPVITEIYAKRDFNELRSTNKTVTKWVFMIMLPMVLLMMLFSKQVLYILYGSPYVIGALSLCILAIGYLVFSLFYLTNQILPTTGRTKLVLLNMCIGAFFNVILNTYLIPIYGITGAAFATTLSFLIIALCAFSEVYHITKIQPFKLNYTKIGFASLVSLVVVYVVTRFLFNNTIPVYVLIAMLVLYMVLYAGLLLVLRSFEAGDIVIMKLIEKKVGLKSIWVRNIVGRFL